jgi:exonuclease III
MNIVSWNCGGLGIKINKEAMGKLIREENPQILLIQETKIKGPEALHELQQLRRTSIGVEISARGASGGICTLWNATLYHEESIFEASHWLMVKLKHLPSGKVYHIINVYMPNNYWEKIECWDSLLASRILGFIKIA